MKKLFLMAAFAVTVMFALTACEKEDDGMVVVDLSQLTGSWSRDHNYPEPAVGGATVSYTFDANGEGKKHIGVVMGSSTVSEFTYEVSTDEGTVITLYGKESGNLVSRYVVTKLNAGEMMWKGSGAAERFTKGETDTW